MRTVLLGNGRLSVEVGEYLASRRDLIGVVLPPAAFQGSVATLRNLGVPAWEWPDGFDAIKTLRPNVLLSVLFEFKLSPEWLRLAGRYALNLHFGYLPHNRGRAPYIWPLIDGSPSGVSLHIMDDGVDSGAILAREPVPVYHEDTAGSAYGRLESAALTMLRNVWPQLGATAPIPQPEGGSVHRRPDIEALVLTQEDLPVIDKLRALTGPAGGAIFTRAGKRYRARISIERMD